MDINQTVANYSTQPITHQLLKSWLKDYKRPNDKINALKSEGVLASEKKAFMLRGLYHTPDGLKMLYLLTTCLVPAMYKWI